MEGHECNVGTSPVSKTGTSGNRFGRKALMGWSVDSEIREESNW